MKLLYIFIILYVASCSACQKSSDQLLRDCKHAQLVFNQCVTLYPRIWPFFCKQQQAEVWLICRNIKEYRRQRLIRNFLEKI